MAVLGVDGWRGRWVGAVLDGRTVTLLDLPDAPAVLAVPDAEVVAVDMPIGLSEGGERECDAAARRLLGRRGRSVFPAPVRPVLGCSGYAEACAASRAAPWGKAPSRQAWNLVPAIRDLDNALGEPPDPRVAEAHPELAFTELDPRVDAPKATARGVAQRIRALEPVMNVLDALAGAPLGVPVADCLDACAVAWSARRIADGVARHVGDDGARDARDRPMLIRW